MAEEKTALVLIADGSEEMEAVISIDVLRRAGIRATVGLVGGSAGIATCGKGVKLAGDISFAEAESLGPYDVVVVPGGMEGSKALAASTLDFQCVMPYNCGVCAVRDAYDWWSAVRGMRTRTNFFGASSCNLGNEFYQDSGVKKLLADQFAAGRRVAAICAAPAVVLTAAGVGEGRRVTCYPSLESGFGDKYNYIADEKVVVDGNLITSQGPGTAFDFALKVASELVGEDKAKAVAKAMLL